MTPRCLATNCNRPRRAGLFCNPCYLKQHFQRKPRTQQTRGFRHALAKDLAALLDISYQEGITVIDAVCRTMIDGLHRGEEVNVRGFGSFASHNRHPRGWGHKYYFRPSKELKYMINHPEYKGQ